MYTRAQTRIVKNHNLLFGKSNNILIQSMCDIKTSNVEKVIKQINACARCGANLMRVSVLDEDDANAIKIIKKSIKIPLVADIHFDYKLALLAMENGVDKIRINPGNIKNEDEIVKIIECAKKNDVIIRIGVNSGSLEHTEHANEADDLVNAALKYIDLFEKNNFFNIVVSLKSSNPITTYQAYKLFSEKSDYPLHIGVTESGFDDVGIIRSVAGLSPLLIDGIGNTIRISLTQDPLKEIDVCKKLLHDLGLYKNYPTIISCPTCGRCEVSNIKKIAQKILKYCIKNKKDLTISIMGCIVNGVGEGKNADLGIAGGKNSYIIFKKGQILKTVNSINVLDELYKEIDNF